MASLQLYTALLAIIFFLPPRSADSSLSLPSYSPGRFPLTEVLTLPLGFISGYQATKMKPILAEYVKMTKSKGLPGEEALRFVQDYLKTHP